MISLRKAIWMLLHPRAARSELREVIQVARAVPKFSERPWFHELDTEAVSTLLTLDRAVIEYGAGSSTLFFARQSRAVYSVDSSKSYVSAVRREAVRQKLANVTVTTADLGPVGPWGWPIDHYATRRNMRKWREYLRAPWEALGSGEVGLVIVDGRFRAACAAYSVAKLLERGIGDAKIFLDDFVGREPNYGCLAEIADLDRTAGRGVMIRPRIRECAEAYRCAERWISDLS